MQFIFVVGGHAATTPQIVSTDRLLLRATRETHQRQQVALEAKKKKKRHHGASPSLVAGGPLQIALQTLLKLCWEESPLSATTSLATLRLNCAITQAPYASLFGQEPIRIVSADDVATVFFNVHEDLLLTGRLVVFTHEDNLLAIAVDGTHLGSNSAAGQKTGTGAASLGGGSAGAGTTTPSSFKRTRRGGFLWGDDDEQETSTTTAHRDMPPLPHAAYLRSEPALDVVPSAVTCEDIKEINILIDREVIKLAGVVADSIFCSQCFHIPLLTLTMSCCGAALCQHCAPTPPTVQGVPIDDRLCPVCGEDPIEPPTSHPKRDELTRVLVKELKVFYMPQLKALRASRPIQLESASTTPTPSPYLRTATPILGPR